MSRLRCALIAVALPLTVGLASCSSGTSSGPITGPAAGPAVGAGSGAPHAGGTALGGTSSPVVAPAGGGGGGAFCGDMKRTITKAATIARSLSAMTPDQLRPAIDADMQMETTAAAEAPGGIRPDVLLASHAHQYQALARAGYDIRKVNRADLETTPLQKTAVERVRTYLIAHCGFDPYDLAPAGA